MMELGIEDRGVVGFRPWDVVFFFFPVTWGERIAFLLFIFCGLFGGWFSLVLARAMGGPCFLGGSGVLSQGTGSLFVCVVCLFV